MPRSCDNRSQSRHEQNALGKQIFSSNRQDGDNLSSSHKHSSAAHKHMELTGDLSTPPQMLSSFTQRSKLLHISFSIGLFPPCPHYFTPNNNLRPPMAGLPPVAQHFHLTYTALLIPPHTRETVLASLTSPCAAWKAHCYINIHSLPPPIICYQL